MLFHNILIHAMNSLTKNLRMQYLDTMGITVWVRRSPYIEPVPAVLPADSQKIKTMNNQEILPTLPEPAPSQADWETLIQEVSQCTACELHKTRTQTVFGVGNRQTACLFVGEAPGASEDAQGEPFVGRAGRLLNEMLRAIQLSREQIFIANILKCRPPSNRDPDHGEMACCTPFLRRQIELIQPKLIVALGRIAAQYLLATTTAIGKLRGKRFEYADTGIPLIPTFHPAYLLRSPQQKKVAWQDLQLIQQIISGNDKP